MPNALNVGIFNKHCYSILNNLNVKLELKETFLTNFESAAWLPIQ